VNTRHFVATALAVAIAACSEAPDDAGPLAPDGDVSFARSAPIVQGTGGGGYVLPLAGIDLPGTFAFSAIQFADGRAQGQLRFTLDVFGLADLGLADGQAVFHGEVTCVSHDPENNRLWVGGVVTRNASTQPDFAADPVAQVGDDIWFRVVDYGEGASAEQPDRITFTGFEGGAGIFTSEEYCATQPWPDDDARTNAVVSGNVQVH